MMPAVDNTVVHLPSIFTCCQCSDFLLSFFFPKKKKMFYFIFFINFYLFFFFFFFFNFSSNYCLGGSFIYLELEFCMVLLMRDGD